MADESAPGFTVRRAVLADAPTLVEFAIAMASETEKLELDRERVGRGVEVLLGDLSKGTYFLATDASGDAVGCLMLTYEWSDWRAAQFYWIQSVYVRPEYRRQGVFRCLFEHVQRLSREASDCCGLRLYVESTNEAAQRTYTAMGMSEAHYRFFEVDYVFSR